METKKFNILITGGLGTLGRPLTEELRQRGHTVWVTAPNYANYPQCIRCDVAYYRQLAHVFETHRFDYVYHCANEFGRKGGEEFYESLWNTNAVGMRNLLSMQERYGFGLIYPGSAEMHASLPVATESSQEKKALVLDNDYT